MTSKGREPRLFLGELPSDGDNGPRAWCRDFWGPGKSLHLPFQWDFRRNSAFPVFVTQSLPDFQLGLIPVWV